ncbi:hypothetical protein TYRP_017063 [Tyrophagus putrescentiae]|nr:hypothetical protein TYRP_017063 [Tyrophagus putrescentiae]
MQQIKDKLNKLDKKLDEIDRHIGEVIVHIESVAIEVQYKNQVKYLRDLKDEYKRFIDNPTNITRHDFHHKCGDLKAIEFIHYIDREMNGEELLPLRREMADSFEIGKVKAWSGRIATMLADATFLHFACVGVSGFSAETINRTLEGVHGDKAIVQGLLGRISAGIQQIQSTFEAKYFEHASGEVDHYLSAYESDSHEQFTSRVYYFLTDKYPFRDWYVASWWTSGYENHAIRYHDNVHSNYWHHTHGRCLIVAAAPPGLSVSSFVGQRDYCLSTYHGSSRALSIEEYLQTCFNSWEVVSVVYKGGLMVYNRGTASHYYTIAHINGYQYHITAIPGGNTAFYSDVSNRTTVLAVEELEGGGDFEEGLEELN